jgi:hypothetical protein
MSVDIPRIQANRFEDFAMRCRGIPLAFETRRAELPPSQQGPIRWILARSQDPKAGGDKRTGSLPQSVNCLPLPDAFAAEPGMKIPPCLIAAVMVTCHAGMRIPAF